MTNITRTLAKASVATLAAGAMAFTAAAPAHAQSRYRDNDGIDVGDIIAGAVILGGIAAVASAAGRDRYGYDNYRYDNRYRYNDRYDYRGSPRSAVEQCVRAVESNASRYGYNADVTEIRKVKDKRRGWEVEGRIAVNQNRYGRYGNYDRYSRYNRGYDTGKFECEIENGRVRDIDYDGIRGLR